MGDFNFGALFAFLAIAGALAGMSIMAAIWAFVHFVL